MTRRRRVALALVAVVALAALAGALYERLAAARDARRFPPPGERVLVGERRVHLHCRGEGAPTLLVLPGSGSGTVDWLPAQKRLAREWRTCVVDRAGYGWSDPLPPGSAPDPVARLHALVQAAALERPLVLVAHSLGGLVARAYALEHPEAVVGLVLLDARHEDAGARLPEALQRAEAGQALQLRLAAALARLGLLRAFAGALVPTPPNLPPEAAAAYRAHAVCAAPYEAMLREGGEIPALAARVRGERLDLPLVVLRQGRPDAFAPLPDAAEARRAWGAMQEELARLSPTSTLLVAPESGHNLHLDAPERVVEAVAALEQLRRQP